MPSKHWPRFLAWVLTISLDGAGAAGAAPALWQVPGTFVDENDRQVVLKDVATWAGTRTVVAMDSAECRFVCSTQWRKLMEVQTAADRRGLSVRFLIISIDPANDSPALWRQYRREKGLSRENWRFLIGSRTSTERVAAMLGLRWWMHDNHVIHDFRLVRLDASGQAVAAMENYSMPADAFLGD